MTWQLKLSVKNDTIIFEELPENGSKEAYEIAFELRPWNKEYYEMVDGKYSYKEEEDDNDEE